MQACRDSSVGSVSFQSGPDDGHPAPTLSRSSAWNRQWQLAGASGPCCGQQPTCAPGCSKCRRTRYVPRLLSHSRVLAPRRSLLAACVDLLTQCRWQVERLSPNLDGARFLLTPDLTPALHPRQEVLPVSRTTDLSWGNGSARQIRPDRSSVIARPLSRMSNGPLPSKLTLLSSLPSHDFGEKVRFLGWCVACFLRPWR